MNRRDLIKLAAGGAAMAAGVPAAAAPATHFEIYTTFRYERGIGQWIPVASRIVKVSSVRDGNELVMENVQTDSFDLLTHQSC